MYRDDFILGKGTYLLNHSVGRPLKQTREIFSDAFFLPWEQANQDLWPTWLKIVKMSCSAVSLRNNDSDFDGIIVVVIGVGPVAIDATIEPILLAPSVTETKNPLSNF